MEKQAFLAEEPHSNPNNQARPRRSPLKPAVIFGLLLLAVYSLAPSKGTWFPLRHLEPSNEVQARPFSWDDLPSKQHLDWHNCYHEVSHGLKCARLELPMDYWNGTTNATTSIAVVKKPAAVPITHPQYGGAILFNPGGPGGSGVFFVAAAGEVFQRLIDSKDGKKFDIIGFDPRGVVNSRPIIQCPNDTLLYQTWALRELEQGAMSASDAAFGRIWSIAEAQSKSCTLPPTDGKPDMKKYVNTASVARDMIEIIERHGEWREKEADRILNRDMCPGRRSEDGVAVPEALKHQVGKEKINYWGFSYGTYLGNTFAAMFPDRINRLVVDGVVDAYDYKKSLWLDNLVDTEKDLDLLYYHCARVGYPTCALANKTGPTTAEGVKNRTYNILQSLYHNPLPVIDRLSPEVITYSDMKYLILGALYSPIQGFPLVAEVLADIERGDGSRYGDVVRSYHRIYCPDENDDIPFVTGDATSAIACTDGDEQSWVTRDMFREHVANLTKISPSVGDLWAVGRLRCIHFSVRPNHRFEGPWVGDTSHPILEIGNTADPVTPGRYAKKMAKGFKGAVALIQDSGGHCSLAAPSRCTQAYVKNYFQTGELPPKDTVCKVDWVPFGPTPEEESVLDVETKEAMGHQAIVMKAFHAAGGGAWFHGMNTGVQRAMWPSMG